MKLRDLMPSDRFTAKFYASAEDAQADEPCLTLTGEYLCPSEDYPDMCICRFDGVCVGYEPADLEVERIDA